MTAINRVGGAGEIDQQLKALAVLPEDRLKSQHPYNGSQPPVTPVPRQLTPLPASVGTRHMHGTQTYSQGDAYTHKKVNNSLNKLSQKR